MQGPPGGDFEDFERDESIFADINITPLTDVFLVLLIIFMVVSSSMVEEERTSGSQGRKLEFLCQQMFREANTIGSKSNDVGVAHTAVEIKTAIERMKEIVANVE